MTVIETKPAAPSVAAPSLSSQAVPRPSARPLRLLAVVDGTERTNRVVDYVISAAQCRAGTEAVILNVQEKHGDARLRGYESFKQSEVDDRLMNDVGQPIVGAASRTLEKAGVETVAKVAIGRAVEEVLHCAAEAHCDAIVVGAPAATGLSRWLAAFAGVSVGTSIAGRLAAVSDIPVVVVR